MTVSRWTIAGIVLLICRSMSGAALAPTHTDEFAGHPRAIIISDIGNEPDDQMSLVRLLLYSNEIDIEALVASTSTWQKTVVHPETMRALIQAYGQVRPNLLLHAQGWPAAEDLDGRVFTGQTRIRHGGHRPEQHSEGAAGDHSRRRPRRRPSFVDLRSGAAPTRWRRR